ncbi:DUF1015 family protein [Phaeacidiphilus oryzae]|uniref:DUF1015 family protein n=1 Tax=Phaeacidiphilus oryzae TaxID=348818 RepID=UPI000A06DDC0|nr:DUF1015 domain-containing protein [Phaeacidiphilus oryzae]
MDQVSPARNEEPLSDDPSRVASCGLSLAPFRGLRYAPERISSLAAVTSPPYDVVDLPDGRDQLETADPHNIVRLILPHNAEDPAARYRHAGELLDAWQRQGVLRPDPEPALYVYEQQAPESQGGTLQRGLIGALTLSGPESGLVLPHEDVMPQPVADRVALMRTTRANLEPLLLTYQGNGGAAEVIERTAATRPVLETATTDGTHHRLWSVTGPADLAAVARDLATCRALIADGHHRWATYRRLQQEHRYLARSPWERGMVLLVDTARYPLRVRAIHRLLQQVPLRDAVAALTALGPQWQTQPLPSADGAPPSPAAVLSALASAKAEHPDRNAYVLAGPEPDGTDHAVLVTAGPGAIPADALPADRPEEWRLLDATVLHSVLLDRVWRVPDAPEHIRYFHDARAAVREARRHSGTAVLMHPVAESTVLRLAEQGVTMPRKSTSFGPKPATGLVLRSLHLD